MKQSLQLRLSQHLALTPQLQQSIRLLQLSTLELNQELEKFIEDNPLLERDEPDNPPELYRAPGLNGEAANGANGTEGGEQRTEAGAGEDRDSAPVEAEVERESNTSDSDWLAQEATSFGSASREDDDNGEFGQGEAVHTDLRAHLRWQLGFTKLSERDHCLVSTLIESIDDDGYLNQDFEELATMFPEDFALEPEELAIALRHLQSFEPTGIGARSVAECLTLQLAALDEDTPGRAIATIIARDHLDVLAARDFAKLKKLARCDDDELRTAHALVKGLNPRPGAAFAASDTRYVVPDVIVRKIKNVWTAGLNQDAIPRLRINRMYADILQSKRGGAMSGQLQEARWLIKNVQQRFDTILRVSQAIIDRQRHFFEHGEVAMRPLVLREIADVLGLHESTVSRVTTQKYMLTPRGIFELKYFFGSHVATEAGGACSATAIRALIKQLVGAENAVKPLSDSKISQILGQQGIVVARRTIAKYRESLHIPPVNLRKTM
jgi:RNA polymerase sigma-54 factor